MANVAGLARCSGEKIAEALNPLSSLGLGEWGAFLL